MGGVHEPGTACTLDRENFRRPACRWLDPRRLHDTWTGPARIDACEKPHHLLLNTEPGTSDEAQIEAWLTEVGSRTRLVVEERGLPLERLYFHGAGWQAHLEDLGRALRSENAAGPDPWTEQSPEPGWRARWTELTPTYEQMVID
jgi:hypothetical protein